MALRIAQIQKAQAEAPVPAGLRQASQQFDNPLVVLIQLRGIAISRLAHAKCAASQRNTHSSLRHCCRGHLTTLAWPRYFFPRTSFSSLR